MIIRTDIDRARIEDMTRVALRLFSPQRVHMMMATAGKATVQRHLIKLAGERGAFYGNFARGVYAEADAEEGRVVIPPAFGTASAATRGNPLAAHYFGKTFTERDLTAINPKTGRRVQNYTIPTAAAHGTRAGDYGDNLAPIFSRKGGTLRVVGLALKALGLIPGGFVAKRQAGLRKAFKTARAKGFSSPMLFVLVKGFKLKGGDGVGDPSVLPSAEDYEVAILAALRNNVMQNLSARGMA